MEAEAEQKLHERDEGRDPLTRANEGLAASFATLLLQLDPAFATNDLQFEKQTVEIEINRVKKNGEKMRRRVPRETCRLWEKARPAVREWVLAHASDLDAMLEVRAIGAAFKTTWPSWLVWCALTTFKDTPAVLTFLRRYVFRRLPRWDKEAIRRALGMLVGHDHTAADGVFLDARETSGFANEMDIILWGRMCEKELRNEWVCPKDVVGFLWKAASCHQSDLYREVDKVKIKLVAELPEWAGRRSRTSSLDVLDDRDSEERAEYAAAASAVEVREKLRYVGGEKAGEYVLETGTARVGARGLQVEWRAGGEATRRMREVREDLDPKAARDRARDEKKAVAGRINPRDVKAKLSPSTQVPEEKPAPKRRSAKFYAESLDAWDPDTIGHAPGLPPTSAELEEDREEDRKALRALLSRLTRLEALPLTPTQRIHLAYRRAGYTRSEIRRKRGVSREAVRKVEERLLELADAV